jgi:hypothetical protein
MNLKRIYILWFLVSFSLSAFSQVESGLSDSINEITIYEYDTIYLQPDTIRLIDTIVDIVKIPSTNQSQSNLKNSSSPNSLFIIPNSIGINISPFFGGSMYDKNVSDSLYSKLIFNYAITGQINYQSKKYLLSIGIGLSPFKETHYFKTSTNHLIADSTGIYDSVMISNKSTYNYYINYLNFNVLIGRKWQINKKWSVNFKIGCFTDFLLGYKQGNTNNPDSLVQKFNLSIGFSPGICYKAGKRIEFFISPFYQYSLFRKKEFPYTASQKTGIGLGFNINLKKR